MTGILTSTAIIMGGIIAIGKLLWNLSAKWTRTSDQLEKLGDEIKELVILKERDHARIEQDNESLRQRLERHEQWHAEKRRK